MLGWNCLAQWYRSHGKTGCRRKWWILYITSEKKRAKEEPYDRVIQSLMPWIEWHSLILENASAVALYVSWTFLFVSFSSKNFRPGYAVSRMQFICFHGFHNFSVCPPIRISRCDYFYSLNEIVHIVQMTTQSKFCTCLPFAHGNASA